MTGKLSMVATPIGNLGDMTMRAIETLKAVDVVYCEDTRVTGKLLAHFGIKKPLYRLDAVVEREKTPEVIARLARGEHVAYASDAGTPGGLSDPGAYLVARVSVELPEVFIEPIPGASPVTAALSVAGVPANDFLFMGFLPHKKGRQTALREVAATERTVMLFESPHRIAKLFRELAPLMPVRQAVILRELTKMYESHYRGTVSELNDRLAKEDIPARGEFVVVIAPARMT
jgi:16S rRNA (cytidine1402-2'-O)-methyltransferase